MRNEREGKERGRQERERRSVGRGEEREHGGREGGRKRQTKEIRVRKSGRGGEQK